MYSNAQQRAVTHRSTPPSRAVTCWQALVGGRYALLARPLDGPRDGPLQPRPDFWVALLWRRLMGTRVLAVHLLVQPDASLPVQVSIVRPWFDSSRTQWNDRSK